MKKLFVLLLLASLAFGLNAQQNRPFREKIEAQKVAFITKELNLTVQESQKFWPIYNEYWDKMENLRDGDMLARAGSELSDEKARELINKFLDREENELKLKKQLYNDLRNVLPPTKIVKLHRAEMQFKQKLLEHIKNRR
jgi:Spy/CpxP family protein refolding chaperone